ncbi:uncharacterized protein F54H12.2-like [Copidosoma floridanum]|uniref:uncharacterized protein F54H12.2-like n=1 Tax=Copidosoma floridanum TaxID=29053 RepID=UPI0006C9D619|nr:uncharacterized protein F54H12.2-like [Copidosoma floridanum]
MDLIGHLHCNVFNQDKLLLNGVEVYLHLVRSKNAFCLMDASTRNYSVSITEAILLVQRVKVSPTVLIARAKSLASTTAKYPITRVEVKSFTMHSGTTGDCLENVILGQLPKKIILGSVDNKAFNGDRKLNLFNFQNYSNNFMSLYVNGVQIPSKPLQPTFTRSGSMYVEAYQILFSGSGIHNMNEGNKIHRKNYPKGYCLFAFDLTLDLPTHFAGHWNLVRNKSVRVEVRFETPLTKTINCALYSELDKVLEIDSDRHIVVDFNA